MSSERNIADVLVDDGRRGVVLNMTREQYRGLRRMNASCLVEGLLDAKEIDPTIIKDTWEGHRPKPKQALQDAYDRGTLAHLILLQPELIPSRVAVWEGRVRSGNEWEAFEAEHDGKLIMTAKDVRDVQAACREFRNVAEVRAILAPCDTEVAVFGQLEGVCLMGLIDAVTRDGECVILDPKTTRKGISYRAVTGAIRDYNYRERMALYRYLYQEATGRTVEKVQLIFLSLPPERIGVRLVTITDEALDWGLDRMREACKWVRTCIESNYWPTFFAATDMGVSDFESNVDEAITGLD